MTRPLLAQDWTAVLTYANRIKNLYYACETELDPNVLQALLVFRPILILFPKLHTLQWAGGPSDLTAMITLIGQKLKTLNIDIHSTSEDDTQVITSSSAYIGAHCPNLESLAVFNASGTIFRALEIDSLVSSSKRLQHFVCSSISCSQSSLLALAKLDNLLQLSLRLSDGMLFPMLTGFETFPALRDLTIDGHFHECLNFFEAMNLARLRSGPIHGTITQTFNRYLPLPLSDLGLTIFE